MKLQSTSVFYVIKCRKDQASCTYQSLEAFFPLSLLIKHISIATVNRQISAHGDGRLPNPSADVPQLRNAAAVLMFPCETLCSASCTEEPVITGSTVMKSLSPDAPALVTVLRWGCYCACDQLLNVLNSSLTL